MMLTRRAKLWEEGMQTSILIFAAFFFFFFERTNRSLRTF